MQLKAWDLNKKILLVRLINRVTKNQIWEKTIQNFNNTVILHQYNIKDRIEHNFVCVGWL